MAKFKLETFTTPPGIARMAFITTPSTKFDPDGVFSTKIAFDDPDEVADIIAKAEELIENKTAEVLKEKPALKKTIKRAPVFTADVDEEGDETGKIIINFKRAAKQKLKDGTIKTNKVKVIDVEGNVVEDEVWSGSTIAARFFMSPYFAANDKSVGVSMKLTHVQVIDLVSGGSGDGPEDTERLGFGKREGYVAKKPAANTSDDAGDTDSSDDGDADF